MKKKTFLFLFTLLFPFAACNRAEDTSQKGGELVEEETPKHSYKSTMTPFDQLVHAERIVILQNVFNPGAREGFYTRDTRPAAVEIEYNGTKADAWPISHAIGFLHKGCEGTVAVTKTGGGKAEFSAADFRGMYVMLDLRSGAPPVLYNPATKSTVIDFAYAVTGAGEAIYSVVSGSDHNVSELLAKAGWNTGAAYRFVATDKFYIPVEPEAAASGELRGAPGIVNGSFPDLSIAHGKINDVLFIERIAE